MGFFEFLKDAGNKILGKGNDSESIKKEIQEHNKTMPIENLEVEVKDDTVTIKGHAKTQEDKVKAALIAGNIKGVSKVSVDDVSTDDNSALDEIYYEVQKGDTLWRVAQIYYKDGSRYKEIVQANLEVIKDADKIYPGQMIRIPNFKG